MSLSTHSRRDFLKNASLWGSLLSLGIGRLFAISGIKDEKSEDPQLNYRYKVTSVDHFGELQEDIDRLKRSGSLSRNEIFQSYLKKMKFTVPEKFPEAKYVIILSVFTPFMVVPFHWKGKIREVLLPSQYYDDGVTPDVLKAVIRRDILPDGEGRIEWAEHLHLKLLAVRSGLGRYGRNNICYVDGMGSYLTLYALFTDHPFEREDWGPVQMLESCKRCPICYGICPTGAIHRDPFVIDAGRCVTLYNESEGKFPSWMRPGMHNALIGCMKCQKRCPENAKLANASGRMEDITEEETRKILIGTPDDEVLKSLRRKLRDFYLVTSKERFPLLTRNLGTLIQ
jgi:epoxyqueuosine reductase